MTAAVWCFLLLAVSLLLLFCELLLPTGGVLGFLSGAAGIGALVVAFREGPVLGLGAIAALILCGPLVFALAAKVWPHTPMGRQILQRAPTPEEVLPVQEDLSWVMGATGTARNRMVPSGVVEIQGREFDAVVVGEVIEPGEIVTVIKEEQGRLTVRKASFSPSERS